MATNDILGRSYTVARAFLVLDGSSGFSDVHVSVFKHRYPIKQ